MLPSIYLINVLSKQKKARAQDLGPPAHFKSEHPAREENRRLAKHPGCAPPSLPLRGARPMLYFFLESTFNLKDQTIFLEGTLTHQNNPKRQTAGPPWGSPKLDL